MAEEEAPVAEEQPRVVFALTPSRISNAVLDYSQTSNIKLYKGGIAAIKPEFDVNAENLNMFLASLTTKVNEYNWSFVTDIPRDLGNPIDGEQVSLLTNYGEVSLEHVRSHVMTYANLPNRVAQDSIMMYECIWNTLSTVGRSKIWIWKDDFHVHDDISSGALLLKVILREAHIDTNATVRHLREKIGSLDEYIATIGHDIEKFNMYVINVVNGLKARGHMSQDVLANLFKAYKAVPDREFVRYIHEKEDAYDDGADIAPETLMLRASDKYRRMVEAKQWKAPTPEQEKIVALESTVKKLMENKKKAKQNEKKTGKSEEGKKKDSETKKKVKKEKPEWMTKPPASNESTTKTVENKEYHWCATHKAWGRHKASECQGLGVVIKKKQKEGAKTTETKKPEYKLTRAMETVATEDEE